LDARRVSAISWSEVSDKEIFIRLFSEKHVSDSALTLLPNSVGWQLHRPAFKKVVP